MYCIHRTYAMIDDVHPTPSAASGTAGSQTLARGIQVLKAAADAPDGLSATETGELAGVHRTVAYRILNTLSDARLLHRGQDGRYREAAGLLALANAAHLSLRTAALPILRATAEELEAAVALIVREGTEAVALAVVTPGSGRYHIAFSEGSRHPLMRGAAGHAVMASSAPSFSESPAVTRARTDGFARTYGEVDPGMHGLSVPLPEDQVDLPACLNIITMYEDRAVEAVAPLQPAARKVLIRLSEGHVPSG